MSAAVLWNVRPSPTGRQLIMFPFLGGFGASYNRLVNNLSGDWDVWTVNPPGHGPSHEPPIRRLADMVDCYLENLRDVLRPDAVFFGHSMGGIIAYRVLTAMTGNAEYTARRPTELVVSAARAPRRLQVAGIAALPERELLQHLLGFGAIPEEVAADRSLLEMFLPAFRADYEVLTQAQELPVVRLDVPAHLILGGRDSQTPEGTPADWQEHFDTPIRVHVLPEEGHMFVLTATDPVDRILSGLTRTTAGAPAGGIPAQRNVLSRNAWNRVPARN